MPYKDKNKQREYQKNWMRKRRESFFNGKKCVKCGSVENLELHHVNPKEKESHNIWSWCEERRSAEIKKCVVWCEKCHLDFHSKEQTGKIRLCVSGENNVKSILREREVLEIKLALKNYERGMITALAEKYNVTNNYISDIKREKSWKNLKV